MPTSIRLTVRGGSFNLVTRMKYFSLGAGLLVLVAGCKSLPNDPPTPQAGYGYLDFYAEEEPGTLSWDIQRYDVEAKHFKLLFSEVDPVPSRVVRVPLHPGDYQVQVAFLNRAIKLPAVLNVAVQPGMVTPVKVELRQGEVGAYQTREMRYGPTARGHYGRIYQTRSKTGSASIVTAQASSSIDYHPKEEMPYAKAPAP
jgi:hypothetical protein